MIFEVIITVVALAPYLTVGGLFYSMYHLAYIKMYLPIKKTIEEMSELLADLNTTVANPEVASSADETTNHREFLIYQVELGKGKHLPPAWRDVKKLTTANGEQLQKLHADFVSRQAEHKATKLGQAVAKHVVKMITTTASQVAKVKNLDTFEQTVNTCPIMQDSMSSVGAFLQYALGPVLLTVVAFAAHLINHVDWSWYKNTANGEQNRTITEECQNDNDQES